MRLVVLQPVLPLNLRFMTILDRYLLKLFIKIFRCLLS